MHNASDKIGEWNRSGLLAEVVGYETDEVALSAAGSSVVTYSGNRFLDFTSGIAVHACGHGHDDVVTAIQSQAASVIHTSDVLRHRPQLALANWLRDRFAESNPGAPWVMQFMNSGSESIDTAAKLALKATGRSRFIAFQGAFHGRTLFATALSCSNTAHKRAYAPLLSALSANILHAPAPRGGAARTAECIAGLEALLDANRGEISAIFFEAQQGEGGYFPMPPEIAAAVSDLAQRHGALLVADEIQCGFGRTGRWFGYEHLGIHPDIVVFGKAIGGGLPLAGIAAPEDLVARWHPGEHGTTFGGNPIACAAGLAALECIERENLVVKALASGEQIKAHLCALVGKNGVQDVRGNGLMLGIEFRGMSGAPDYGRLTAIKAVCRERGLLVLGCGARIGDPEVDCAVIRLLPPLTATFDEIENGLAILVGAIVQTAPNMAP